MNGRNTVTIGFRVSDETFGLLLEVASTKNMTVAALIKEKTESFAEKLKNPRSASQLASTTNLPLYNPTVHKPGNKVLIKQGRRLVETVVPELDADGHVIPS